MPFRSLRMPKQLSHFACVLLGVVIGTGTGCEPSPSETSKATLKVAVSILPQAYFVERIGGPHVEPHVLVGPGQSHGTYDPTPGQLIELSRCSLFFRIGVAIEDRLLKKLAETHPKLEIVDTREGIKLRHMAGETHAHDDHGCTGTHDPHIWLDPMLVKVQTQTICEALKRADPNHADDYDRNLSAFHADLDNVHRRISELLAPLTGKEFFVFHPAFGYFADAYGLTQVAIETAGKEAGPRQLVRLIDHAQKTGVRLIFVQKQFASNSAKAVAEAIGGSVVPIDPLERHYLRNLEDLAAEIARSLERQPSLSQVANRDKRKLKSEPRP
ncbi:MAG: zinc ABC transporter substrate-binding protein [Phycisphaerales bacterium]|nr:zinc ABC transporter substrate-binding protein [Phycisphaerales bacterium]